MALVVFIFAVPATAATNDPYFARLWGLQRVGAEPAWAVSKGAGVMIAVIDSGVDTNHPDLQGQLLPGFDFVSNDSDPKDENGHGTLMTGIAAAVTGNKVGIASVAPDAKILPVRVFDGDGNANSTTVTKGVDYAIDEAANRNMRLVLNFSFVATGATSGTSLFADPSLELAVRRAANDGAAVVIAAGNEGANQTAYDSITEGIAVVGASDRSDNRAPLSNFGAGLDILAPGVAITSTYWDKATGKSVYAEAQGTSTSVPFVSGAAALLMAQGMNGTTALNRILSTAQDLGSRGRDNDTGHGLLDVAAALGAPRPTQTSPPPKPPPPASPATTPNQNPSPSPSPLVFPSPGEPLVFEPIPTGTSQAPTPTAVGADPKNQTPGPHPKIAGILIALVLAMHLVRRTLL